MDIFFQIHKKVYSTQTVELLIYWNVYSNDVNVTMTVGIFILRDRFFFNFYDGWGCGHVLSPAPENNRLYQNILQTTAV